MLTQEKINVKLIELNMNRELSSNNMTLTNDIIKLHLLWGTRLTNVVVTFQTITTTIISRFNMSTS